MLNLKYVSDVNPKFIESLQSALIIIIIWRQQWKVWRPRALNQPYKLGLVWQDVDLKLELSQSGPMFSLSRTAFWICMKFVISNMYT